MSTNSMIDDLIANDPEMLESFINESRECLVVAEKDLQSLGQDLTAPDPECIERAFRSIHSLKSAAGFLGLDNVSNLALRMEDMLGKMRTGAINPAPENIGLLLEGVSLLNDMLAKPMESGGIDTMEFAAKLTEYLASQHDE